MKEKYTQYSKKLTSYTMVAFFTICILCLGAIVFFEMEKPKLDAIVTTLNAAATLSGVVATGYMGNSSLEKYSTRRYQYNEMLSSSKMDDSENG